ncbi:MAG: TetR/AcrR family transcriptional regulator [Deltaproteobacteria bacterium]|nr:TetR/AcrR family transcriptional regulator [Deltaproteobacteria bacterium]
MARPSTVSTEKILEVALELFLERGFDVPTAEIARTAGISEGSIFNRFSTKQELFIAAMESGSPNWADLIPSLDPAQSVEEILSKIMTVGISALEQSMPRMMLLWSQRKAPSPMEIHARTDSMPRRVLEALTTYFETENQRGRLHCQRPEIAARLIMAAVANYVFIRTLGIQVREPMEVHTYVCEVIQTLLNGMRSGVASAEEQP